MKLSRRAGLALGAASLLVGVRPLAAQTVAPSLADAVHAATGGAALHDGGLSIEIPQLVENGNAVPLRLALMAAPEHKADPVLRLVVLSERNPVREVVALRWPEGWPQGGSGPLPVATRIRLATSQQLVALAQARSGRWWQARADVIVTLAACVEG